ncbi:hypothetical protein FRE64_10085 [Euhalothece natronophila Z-M001]|uniref:Uncharacterized protein n=1 Tax=Euhalothece natronophila Z-M001 TaxID=522448 RepID=A0A5B8NQ11_9CHRO|nr:hypothetical protein [Euhalothece natronophila]QDZ40270.1 hypothetical protein FRE64_10085 [Euhalothece natronophila Z-M001]
MGIEWIILVASLIILFLVVKAILRVAIVTLTTAFQILIILIILRVFFLVMPKDVIQQIQELPNTISNLLLPS